MSKDNNKKWRNAGLYVLLAIVVVALGTAFLDKQPQARETWAYSKLIDEVQNNQVETVKISADRTKAQVINSEGTPILVNLPNDPELIDILSTNGVDISVLPQSDEGFWFRA
ncbi:MAG: ATP-dependent metallopeptidase FtsH/Yme1/Tma family protein, partial [Waterburya sp.]